MILTGSRPAFPIRRSRTARPHGPAPTTAIVRLESGMADTGARRALAHASSDTSSASIRISDSLRLGNGTDDSPVHLRPPCDYTRSHMPANARSVQALTYAPKERNVEQRSGW